MTTMTVRRTTMQQARSFYRMLSRLALALLTLGALQACSGEDGSTSASNSTTSIPTVCANVAGTWNVTEDITVTCTLAGQPAETDTIRGTGNTMITQNGCAISYVVPNVDIIRTGTIDGQHVRFTGPFALGLSGDVQFSQNSMTMEGDLQGDTLVLQGAGTARGITQGSTFVCTGDSKATFSRLGASSVARGQEVRSFEEPSLIFLDGAVQLLTIITQ
jgi:hypothetical protein